jgi:hypothetical protein
MPCGPPNYPCHSKSGLKFKPSPTLTLASIPKTYARWKPFSCQEGSETGLGILRLELRGTIRMGGIMTRHWWSVLMQRSGNAAWPWLSKCDLDWAPSDADAEADAPKTLVTM